MIVGGAIGLAGGIGGVFFGHFLTGRREADARAIEGIRRVVQQLGSRRRLALQFDQHVNAGLRNADPEELARNIFERSGWKEATHEMQEQLWRFDCMAYLPEAIDDFNNLDRQITFIMDPQAERPEPGHLKSREQARRDFFYYHDRISDKADRRLGKLL